MRISETIGIISYSFQKNGLKGIRNLLLAYLNLKTEPVLMSSEPLIIQIEPTTHCNLECTMCLNPIKSRENRHMSFEDFKRILDAIPLAHKISLVGAGEPLMNPELFKMISIAKSRRIKIGFATNGLLLNDYNCSKIVENKVDWVNISIDSPNKKIYESIRKGSDFEKLLDGIKRLIQTKGQNKLPVISLWFVILQENLDGLPMLINLAKELGIKKVAAQLAHHWGNEALKKATMKRNPDFYQKLIQVLRETKKNARNKRIEFLYVNIPDLESDRSCKWPWKECYITAEGFITPCCMHGADPTKLNFGNIKDMGFEQIWNSGKYQAFRADLKSAKIPEICLGCPSYHNTRKI